MLNRRQIVITVAKNSTPSGLDDSDTGFAATIINAHTNRMWLPRWLYELLPYFYMSAGAFALWSCLYNRHWSWFVPLVILGACLLLHSGWLIFVMRQRRRRNGRRLSH